MITSLAEISRQAAAAAEQWEPHQPLPTNPYCRETHPEHHAEFQLRLEIALVRTNMTEAA